MEIRHYCFKEIAYNINMKVRLSTVLEIPGANKPKILSLVRTESEHIYTMIMVTSFEALNISASKSYWMASFMHAFMLTVFLTTR